MKGDAEIRTVNEILDRLSDKKKKKIALSDLRCVEAIDTSQDVTEKETINKNRR